MENKNGKDLRDCYKLYFHKAEYRIVYRKKNKKLNIISVENTPTRVAEIIAIGARNKEQVYIDAANRLNR